MVALVLSGCISKSKIDIKLLKNGFLADDLVKPILSTTFSLGAIPDDLSESPPINFLPATDAQSGIDYYEVRIIDDQTQAVVKSWTPITSGQKIENISPLLLEGETYFVEFRARDRAGNYSDVFESSTWVTARSASISFQSEANQYISESSQSANLQIVLSQSRSVDTTIAFTYTGTATLVSDFTFTTPTEVVIPAGSTTVNLTVEVNDDNASEPIEYIDVSLSAPTSPMVTIGNYARKRFYIEDNELQSTAMIASGANHNCYKDNIGRVKCWGRNNWGQLGYGDTNDRGDNGNEMGTNLPFVNLGTGLSAQKISAGNGGDNTCALMNNGRVKCWGYGSNWNEPGYMGYGHSNNIGDQVADMGDNLPYISLGTGVLAKDIVTSSFNSCVITTDILLMI
ncbi:MAG: hypothetical protein HOP07_04610 [Bacteriovoracaceae bacterium]|nr:hypothetical protein [Bacteriovoracaceae bacterium]